MYGSPKLESFRDLQWNEIAVFLIVSLLIVLIGVYPQCLLDFVGPSLDNIIQSVQPVKSL
jgi:NADH:ubiquinone oxidoreductase subunit 4 (subunit M)